MTAQEFTVTVRDGGRGRAFIPVPFDPDLVWTPKTRHHVGGTVDGRRVRGTIEPYQGEWGLLVGAAWRRDGGLEVGARVAVVVAPEGPQRSDLADDIAAALDADPEAAAFFDTLAQFYRRGYLRWIDATKRSPELRAERIAEMVRRLRAGVKDHR